jgi:hypothetical protein
MWFLDGEGGFEMDGWMDGYTMLVVAGNSSASNHSLIGKFRR